MTQLQWTFNLEEQIRSQLLPIEIEDCALSKSGYIARRINEIADSPLEVAVLLLGNRNKLGSKFSIQDVYIGQEQKVTSTKCNISGAGMILSKADIKDRLKMRIMGWGHSHSTMETSHSIDDDETTISFLDTNFTILQTELLIPDEGLPQEFLTFEKVRDHNTLFMKLPEKEVYIYSRIFDVTHHENIVKHNLHAYIKKTVEIPYTISLVFNSKDDNPFCAVAYELDHSKHIIKNVPLEIVSNAKRTLIDKETIDKELVQRIDILRKKYAMSEIIQKSVENYYSLFTRLKESHLNTANIICNINDLKKEIEATYSLSKILRDLISIYSKNKNLKLMKFASEKPNLSIERLINESESFLDIIRNDQNLYLRKLEEIQKYKSIHGLRLNLRARHLESNYKALVLYANEIINYGERHG